ncbi:copper oxidase [Arthrobacter sp. SW1]|uniref:polyphenol oxidase family protein n=1 Tax=Arthrobacter sp. SW1 TaxID=1920889 RepID=UPI000877D455|nr:polyphenol oxidase family protein [Arthrobacter sp. SW1]OFI38328.1 copper oxidase [Arthrobacter sp. SW1]
MFWWREEVRPGVTVAFTDTDAGNLALHVGDDAGDVMARRARLETASGLGGRSFQYMSQVHGNAVAFIDGTAEAPTADAMVSTGQPLAVMVADCVPVVLAGDGAAGPVLGVAHAGRPGVASGVVPAVVAEMRERGAQDIAAWIGPSICGKCYEVPEALRADVAATVPATWAETSWGTPALDLPAGVRAQLGALGVPVEYSGGCTKDTEALFSYRRQQQTGRFAGLIWTHD